MEPKAVKITEDEARADRVLSQVYRIGETPEVANWLLRCMGLEKAARSLLKKINQE